MASLTMFCGHWLRLRSTCRSTVTIPVPLTKVHVGNILLNLNGFVKKKNSVVNLYELLRSDDKYFCMSHKLILHTDRTGLTPFNSFVYVWRGIFLNGTSLHPWIYM